VNPHVFDAAVSWGDCDPAGIVFYPRFFHWMDSAFHDLLRARGFTARSLRERFGVVTPIVEVGATFRAPAIPGDPLRIEVRIERFGEKSFRVAYRFTRGGTHLLDGFESRVWARPKEGGGLETRPIAEEFRGAFA
jgi:YbgC/YbaW family acyl-CoA thioester hydrolase